VDQVWLSKVTVMSEMNLAFIHGYLLLMYNGTLYSVITML